MQAPCQDFVGQRDQCRLHALGTSRLAERPCSGRFSLPRSERRIPAYARDTLPRQAQVDTLITCEFQDAP
jgi:hypothetical protein